MSRTCRLTLRGGPAPPQAFICQHALTICRQCRMGLTGAIKLHRDDCRRLRSRLGAGSPLAASSCRASCGLRFFKKTGDENVRHGERPGGPENQVSFECVLAGALARSPCARTCACPAAGCLRQEAADGALGLRPALRALHRLCSSSTRRRTTTGRGNSCKLRRAAILYLATTRRARALSRASEYVVWHAAASSALGTAVGAQGGG